MTLAVASLAVGPFPLTVRPTEHRAHRRWSIVTPAAVERRASSRKRRLFIETAQRPQVTINALNEGAGGGEGGRGWPVACHRRSQKFSDAGSR